MRPKTKGIKFSEIARLLGATNNGDAVIKGIALDSNRVQKGDVFVALPGKNQHGIKYLDNARANGAVAVITDKVGIAEVGKLPSIAVTNPRKHLFALSSLIYEYHADLKLFAVTGTNGKTSTVEYLHEILTKLGEKTLRVSSLGMKLGNQTSETSLTTPEICDLIAALSFASQNGASSAVLEVSAQALVRARVDGLKFEVSGFTGLSHDHLDDFGDMDSYLAAKARLFEAELSKRGVVFLESKHGLRLSQVSEIPVTTVSLMGEAAFRLEVVSTDVSEIKVFSNAITMTASLLPASDLMARNCALAMLMLLQAGYSDEQISNASVITTLVPGRLQQVSAGPDVFLDYGHTPDAVFQALKELTARYSEVHLVLGFSGDRDHSKRRPMLEFGEAATSMVVTVMHPRGEHPEQIISDLKRHKPNLASELDPEKAVSDVISKASRDSAVLWCGPGHLKYREVNAVKIAFDPEKIIKKAAKL